MSASHCLMTDPRQVTMPPVHLWFMFLCALMMPLGSCSSAWFWRHYYGCTNTAIITFASTALFRCYSCNEWLFTLLFIRCAWVWRLYCLLGLSVWFDLVADEFPHWGLMKPFNLIAERLRLHDITRSVQWLLQLYSTYDLTLRFSADHFSLTRHLRLPFSKSNSPAVNWRDLSRVFQKKISCPIHNLLRTSLKHEAVTAIYIWAICKAPGLYRFTGIMYVSFSANL